MPTLNTRLRIVEALGTDSHRFVAAFDRPVRLPPREESEGAVVGLESRHCFRRGGLFGDLRERRLLELTTEF